MQLNDSAALARRFFTGDIVGFYLAESPDLAHFVAANRGMNEYALIQVSINWRAIGELQAAGSQFRVHPDVNGHAMGREFVIPASAFPVFNAELAAGRIFFNPAPGQ